MTNLIKKLIPFLLVSLFTAASLLLVQHYLNNNKSGGSPAIEDIKLKTFRSEKYKFEFQYPESLAPIAYERDAYKKGSLCFVEAYFFEKTIVKGREQEILYETKNLNEAPLALADGPYLAFCWSPGGAVFSEKGVQPTIENYFPVGEYSLDVFEVMHETSLPNFPNLLGALELDHPRLGRVVIAGGGIGASETGGIEIRDSQKLKDVNLAEIVKNSLRNIE